MQRIRSRKLRNGSQIDLCKIHICIFQSNNSWSVKHNWVHDFHWKNTRAKLRQQRYNRFAILIRNCIAIYHLSAVFILSFFFQILNFERWLVVCMNRDECTTIDHFAEHDAQISLIPCTVCICRVDIALSLFARFASLYALECSFHCIGT